ncbi:MAG: hypothetical protein K8R39_04795 [Arcobacteraceae bacterium]|nr:hypothetical protein [Arcobacteraceae bacterium]
MSLKNRLLIFANDAASASVTLAYAYLYKNQYREVLAFPKDVIAKNIYKEYIPSCICEQNITFEDTDTIITGTSGIDPSYEMNAIVNAKKHNVAKVIVIVDNTIHFDMRFLYKDTIIPEQYIPDEIWIFQKNFISNIEYLNKKFIYTDDIYTKFLNTIFNKKKPQIVHPFIKKNKNNYLVILTEYIYDFYRLKYGFNEYDMLEHILEEIDNSMLNIPIFLKLHPKEHSNKFNILLRKYSHIDIINDSCNIQELIYYSKVVFGINSSVFKECKSFQKATYSIQIDSKEVIYPTYLNSESVISTKKQLLSTLKKHFY